MFKNRKLILVVFIFVLIVVAGLYATYAIGVTSTNNSINSYDLTLTDNNNIITLAAYENKSILYKVKNNNYGKVKYGIGYTNNTNVSVTASSDTIDATMGFMEQNESKFIRLNVVNNASSQQTTTISTILGYENGGELILPSGVTLIPGPLYTVEIRTSIDNRAPETYTILNVSFGSNIYREIQGGNYYTVDNASCTNGQTITFSESYSGNVVNADITISNVTSDTVCTVYFGS